ncbi:SRPBCC family protein [Pedobacter arcticus]|uniref:hypothetical protein n=1 Tax=Pedobacter arcticus TaxID=752140 RepID=UPI000314BF70|nr:hypothetical protein [Pedobacter arcticus]
MKNLKTLSFSIFIDSDREGVWDTLWNPRTYGKWTSVFCEGNYYTGELKQGNTIKFLKEEREGMTSYIQKLVKNEQIVFVHQKQIKDGIETDFAWQGAREIYHLKKETDSSTELQVIVDVASNMEEYFADAFPKSLTLVKQLAEQKI